MVVMVLEWLLVCYGMFDEFKLKYIFLGFFGGFVFDMFLNKMIVVFVLFFNNCFDLVILFFVVYWFLSLLEGLLVVVYEVVGYIVIVYVGDCLKNIF